MTRPAGRTTQVQSEKPPSAVDAADRDVSAADGRPPSRGWRLALFLWATSFGFLLLYELLSMLFTLLFGAGTTGPGP